MESDLITRIEQEIDRLRRRYEALLREVPGAREVSVRWVTQSGALCWFMPLEDVLEPDIDIELAGEVVIVRARRSWPEAALLVGLVPIPSGFDREHPVIRFFEGTLEIRVRMIGRTSAS